jgi:tRNA(adenine34) deaminase
MSIENFMMHAINLAKIAFQKSEVPVGAIIVKNGQIIGEGFNQVISKNSVASHAEINAINDASETLKNYRLNNCDMYVTLEPCHMCAKAIVDARMKHVYFAAREPKTGAIESIDKFFEKSHLNHKVNSSGGYLEGESSKLLKEFFQSRRN